MRSQRRHTAMVSAPPGLGDPQLHPHAELGRDIPVHTVAFLGVQNRSGSRTRGCEHTHVCPCTPMGTNASVRPQLRPCMPRTHPVPHTHTLQPPPAKASPAGWPCCRTRAADGATLHGPAAAPGGRFAKPCRISCRKTSLQHGAKARGAQCVCTPQAGPCLCDGARCVQVGVHGGGGCLEVHVCVFQPAGVCVCVQACCVLLHMQMLSCVGVPEGCASTSVCVQIRARCKGCVCTRASCRAVHACHRAVCAGTRVCIGSRPKGRASSRVHPCVHVPRLCVHIHVCKLQGCACSCVCVCGCPKGCECAQRCASSAAVCVCACPRAVHACVCVCMCTFQAVCKQLRVAMCACSKGRACTDTRARPTVCVCVVGG